jgi:two-component system LytT family response regulator
MRRLRVVIVEDEPLQREYLRNLLVAAGCVISGEFEDVPTAVQWFKEPRNREITDVLFLDYQLRNKGTSPEIVKTLPKDAFTFVFVTAFAEHAAEMYGLEEGVTLDYLLKPVTPERLALTVSRLQERFGLKSASDVVRGFRVVEEDGSIPVISVKKVTHVTIELQDIYVWTADGRKHLCPEFLALAKIEELFPEFKRASKSTLVSPTAITKSVPNGRGGHVLHLGPHMTVLATASYAEAFPLM